MNKIINTTAAIALALFFTFMPTAQAGGEMKEVCHDKVDKAGKNFAYLVDDNADPGSVLWEILKEIFRYMLGARIQPDEGGMGLPIAGDGFILLND